MPFNSAAPKVLVAHKRQQYRQACNSQDCHDAWLMLLLRIWVPNKCVPSSGCTSMARCTPCKQHGREDIFMPVAIPSRSK